MSECRETRILLVDMWRRRVVISDDWLPITQMFTKRGKETDNPANAVTIVAGKDNSWIAVDLDVHRPQTVH